MIHNALRVIQQELNTHLANVEGTEQNLAILGNVSKIEETTNTDMEDMVIISLVNIEEEKILKNNLPYKNVNGNLLKKNPTVFLNCYVLFTANLGDTDTEQGIVQRYERSLRFLSEVVTFFQKKYVFDHQNTPGLDSTIEKLILDIHTLNFENLNHLWGILGGKYLPSVLYKVRLVPIEANAGDLSSVITGVELKDN